VAFVAELTGANDDRPVTRTPIMKLTTVTNVSIDGVVQGLGGADEDRSGGFERGGWALPLFDDEAAAYLGEVYQRADAFLLGRRPTRSSSPTGERSRIRPTPSRRR
jgi:hypothetical protein